MSRVLYVAERGAYESRFIAGIFDSPERAMAAMPGTRWRKTTWTWFPDHANRERIEHTVSWDNGLDWDESVTVQPIELSDAGPVREADEAVVQTYRDSDGGWDYLPEQLSSR